MINPSKFNPSLKTYLFQIIATSIFLTIIAIIGIIVYFDKSREAGFKPEYVPGELTVYFKETISRKDELHLLQEYGIRSKYQQDNDITRKYHIDFSENKEIITGILNESDLFQNITPFVGDFYSVKEKININTQDTNIFFKNHPTIPFLQKYGLTDSVIVPVGQEQKYIKLLRSLEYVRDVDWSVLPPPM